jgi:hypothetical protein
VAQSAKFATGERVPVSGMYRVRHGSHRLPHEVTLLQDQIFPRCERCGELVRFEMLRTVEPGNGFRVQLFSLPVLEPGRRLASRPAAQKSSEPAA